MSRPIIYAVTERSLGFSRCLRNVLVFDLIEQSNEQSPLCIAKLCVCVFQLNGYLIIFALRQNGLRHWKKTIFFRCNVFLDNSHVVSGAPQELFGFLAEK